MLVWLLRHCESYRALTPYIDDVMEALLTTHDLHLPFPCLDVR